MNLKWEKREWEAPDGKKVPFEQADITDELIGMETDRFQDAPMIEVTITRWPRKVTITCIITEGVDGYTNDGDGDGVIFEPVWATKHTLVTTDRATLERDFERILDIAYHALYDIRNALR